MLGDYVDRGPRTAEVIDHLLTPPPSGFARICLARNHEQAMLAFARSPREAAHWIALGGLEPLRSYGMEAGHLDAGIVQNRRLHQQFVSHVPPAHLDFLAGLPVLLSLPDYVFVHAGLRPGVPLEGQRDEDLNGNLFSTRNRWFPNWWCTGTRRWIRRSRSGAARYRYGGLHDRPTERGAPRAGRGAAVSFHAPALGKTGIQANCGQPQKIRTASRMSRDMASARWAHPRTRRWDQPPFDAFSKLSLLGLQLRPRPVFRFGTGSGRATLRAASVVL